MARLVELLNIWRGARARSPCQCSREDFNQVGRRTCAWTAVLPADFVHFGQERIVLVSTLYLRITLP